jgi:hypothetical protein
MWDNLILRDKKMIGQNYKILWCKYFWVLKKKAFSLFREKREKNERSFWSIVWVVVCILYCVINVSVQMNE